MTDSLHPADQDWLDKLRRGDGQGLIPYAVAHRLRERGLIRFFVFAVPKNKERPVMARLVKDD